MTESELQRKVLRMIKKEFPELWCYKASDKWISGLPDVMGCFLGSFFAIELKRPGEKPRPLQDYVMNSIKKAGGQVTWETSVEGCRTFLTNVKKKGGEKNG